MDRQNSKLKTAGRIVLYVVMTLALIIGRSAQWALDEWGGLNLDEILFTLTRPLNGTDPAIFKSYVLYALLPAAAVLFVVVTVTQYMSRRKARAIRFLLPACTVIAAVFCVFQAARFWRKMDIGAFLKNRGQESDWIEKNYADPDEVELTFPEKKRNLLYIYLESMEVAYSDEAHGGIFEDNYIPELTKLSEEAEDFSGPDDTVLNGAISPKYTTWTMGGMFAATSGLPLKIPLETAGVDTNYMSTQDSFFPNITALGDILKKEGYVNDLLIGSDATFGGRRLYFSEHGDYGFHDYNYYSQSGALPPGYKVFWGFEDERLFEFAKERLTELATGDEPFNLTMLTVDTHYPDGYVCRLCEKKYDSQYANVIACSDRQTAEFLKWCKEQDWYADTAVIVSGDHPTMAEFCSGAPDGYERRVYTAYLNSAEEPARNERRLYSTLDNFPTTLAAMGVKIEGERLGLGTNLFSAEDTLLERDGAEQIEEELAKSSKWMDAQANVEPVTADITYDPYDEENHRLSFTIRNVSSDKVDAFRVCMRMYGYIVNGSDYIEWVSAEEVDDGVFYTQFEVPVDKAYDGIVKLQPTCMVDGARSNVLDLHFYHLKYDAGGGNCEWYECDPKGIPLDQAQGG